MSLLRAMLATAVRRKYVDVSPFAHAEPGELISIAAEDSRDVTTTPEEEERLLAACNAPRRRHLRAIIVTAIDTGCRRGELFRLTWRDVDFVNDVFTVTSYKGKNMTRRDVQMTARVRTELLALREKPALMSFRKENMDDTLVFGIVSDVKRAFRAACSEAGLAHMRFHDLRHSSLTALAQSGMNIAQIAKIAGHKNTSTTALYIGKTATVLDFAREVMEKRAAK